MTAYLAPSILIGSVLALMLAATCTVAFVNGWQDGPDNHADDRHAFLPRAFYAAGWRLKRHRLTVARRELEQARRDREARTARFYAALDRAVQDELARKARR